MSREIVESSAKRYEESLKSEPNQRLVLRLYVTGATPASTRAIANLREVCSKHLGQQMDLEVIDIFQQPGLAKGNQIVATPTLIKFLPAPMHRFIGDLAGLENKLFGFEVRARDARPEK